MAKAPGKANRNGISLMELFEMFPDDATAERWFVESRWPDGIRCAFCEGDDIDTSGSHPTQPYRCRDCRRQFSVKVNSVMHGSKLGYRKWAIAIYLVSTSLKGVSSMKLHRDLGVTQKTAWHMLHRIREAYHIDAPVFEGPVEVDETYIGGRESNKHESQKLHAGRGAVGKTAVVGMKDRPTNQVNAQVVKRVNKRTVHGLVHQWTVAGATVYTDEASALYRRGERVHRHSACPRGRKAQREGIRARHGEHQRHGVVLVDAQARLHRRLSQDESEAPASLRRGVRGQAQQSPVGHAGSDGVGGAGRGRQAAEVR